MADDTEKCKSCGRALGARMKFCNYCGWANAQDMRLCLKCEGPVILDNGIGANKTAGGAGGLGGFLMAYFLGLLLSLTILFGFGAALGVASVFTMGYKCGMCDRRASDSVLSSGEKNDRSKRRFGLILTTVGMGVGSIVCLVLWLWLVKSRFSGD